MTPVSAVRADVSATPRDEKPIWQAPELQVFEIAEETEGGSTTPSTDMLIGRS